MEEDMLCPYCEEGEGELAYCEESCRMILVCPKCDNGFVPMWLHDCNMSRTKTDMIRVNPIREYP
jgi:hypothetical protein